MFVKTKQGKCDVCHQTTKVISLDASATAWDAYICLGCVLRILKGEQ